MKPIPAHPARPHRLPSVWLLMALALPLGFAAPAPNPPREIVLHPRAERLPSDLLGPFVRLGDGSVLAVDATQVYVSRDDGRTWRSQALFRDPGKFAANFERAVVRTPGGVVVIAFTNARETVFKWNQKAGGPLPDTRKPVYIVRSRDDGRTWDQPRLLQDGWCGALRQMIRLRTGRLVLASQKAVANPGRHVSLTWISDDEGQTWRQSNLIDLGEYGRYGDHAGGIEGSLLERKDGQLWLLLRTLRGVFTEAFSSDGGLTWENVQPSAIEASPAPGLLLRLHSGRVALFWNRWIDARRQIGRREQLSLAFSEDDGRTWNPPIIVAKDPTLPGDKGPEHRLSYPYAYEHQPGEIWVTTGQGSLRMKIREADVLTP